MSEASTIKNKIASAAQLLLNARSTQKLLPELPSEYRPGNSAEAYAIQDAVVAQLGPIGGWKVGAGSATAEPNCSPLPGSLIFNGSGSFSSRVYTLRGIEGEIGVRMKRDLPPRAEPYSIPDVISAVGSVHPMIEVVESRFTDRGKVDPLSALADAASNGALVYGEGRTDNLAIDQASQLFELYFDSKKVVELVGGNSAGNIWRLMAWLANHVAARCGGLRAGQIVTTGSCTGVTYAKPGARVKVSSPGLGKAELSFSVL
ncbi:MAG TPA: fumarylacetoacetate hydrolase family protein [Paralcaligenes sp.]|jgi:2-keto-4-pentenoate hydratase